MIRKTILAIVLSCFYFGSSAINASQDAQERKIYKWIDKEGRVHYSDIPQRNAVIILAQDHKKLADVTVKTLKAPEVVPQKIKTEDNILTIEKPNDQETLQNTGGELMIFFSSSKPLAQGEQWQVLLDGQKAGEPQTSNNVTLQNIDRGEHTLQIHTIDTHGKVLASSAITTFYMHQTAKP